MADRPLKTTAKVWTAAPGTAQRYRDRKRIILPNGQKRDVVGYGPTKRDATQDLYDKVRAIEIEARQRATLTLTKLMAMHLHHKRSTLGRKRRTIYNDLDLYKRHVKPALGERPIAEITLAELEALQASLAGAGKYRTAELVTTQLKGLYRYAMRIYGADIRAGRVNLYNTAADLDPVKRPEAAKHKPGATWSVTQLKTFLAEAKRVYDESRSHLLYPVFHTAIAAGLRRGELLGLRRSDLQKIELEDGTAYYALSVDKQLVYYDSRHHADSPKTPRGVRSIPIGPELAEVLLAHMAKLDRIARENPAWQRTDLLFPSYNGAALEPRSLYRARDEILRKHDLPHVRLHDLRAIYTTYLTRELVRQGKYSPKLVMLLLGHSKPDVALIHYNQVVAEDLAGATFDPSVAGSLDISLDNSRNEEDAEP